MNPHTSDILTFIQFAKKGETSRKLRGLIEHIPLSDVMAWRDEDGLDLMHHVILGNNSELVAFLLQHNFFVRPHIPEVNPYSHLAALLGERALLQVLLQHRPDDYYPSKVSIRLPQSVIDSLAKNNKMNTSTVLNSTRLSGAGSTSSSSSSTSSSSSLPNNSTGNFYKTESLSELLKNLSNQATSPLDIASRAGHLQCVKVILNQCVLKKHSEDTLLDKSDYTLACIADSPLSLALLIHEQAPSREEWEGAVQVCLHYARPECLDLLLQQKRDTKQMFKGMNFYHVLYTYTSVQGASSYPKLAQTTEVLVKHGHKVGAKVPCRTYPMYSLLTHAFCFHDYSNTQYYIKALRILLKQGADPCFDEVKFEKRHPKFAASKITGRSAFSSALHCLLETVETYSKYLDSPTLAIKFVEDCAMVLMGNNASMNHVGHIGHSEKRTIQGTVLHQLAKSSVALGVNPAMVRCVLRHGADPNLKVDGKYAINVYFDRLFQKLSGKSKPAETGKYLKDSMTMCRLCMFMKPESIRDCLNIFVKDHGRALSDQLQTYVRAVRDELTRRSKQIHSLRDLSAWAVWTSCGCQSERVHGLKISSEFKTFILPMNF